jgi:uncharacterized protein YdaU (DUF1376 family)
MDLTDFPFMPLYIARLQKSKAWLRCKRRPELAFYMLNLWMRAWHETPAGSIEDDDDVLADAAMCDLRRWAKIKDDLMQGWEKGEDGRLYHPVVTEIATESWADKWNRPDRQEQRSEHARAAAKVRWDRARAQSEDAPGTADEMLAAQSSMPEAMPEHCSTDALKGQGEGEGKGEGKERAERAPDGARLPAKAAEEEFERTFWPAYPIKDGKKDAKAAFLKARKLASLEEIMAGLGRYVEKLATPNGPKPKYAQGWLNGERWTDGAPASNGHPPDPDESFRAMIQVYLDRGVWVPTQWGPAIGEPGCKIPPHILAEFRPLLEQLERPT